MSFVAKNPILALDPEKKKTVEKILREVKPYGKLSYEQAAEIIMNEAGIKLTKRQMQYYRRRYMFAKDLMKQALTDDPAEEKWEKNVKGQLMAGSNTYSRKEIRRLFQMIDPLKEKVELYKVQKERIMIDFQTEKKIRKLLPRMHKELETAEKLLSSIEQTAERLGMLEPLATRNILEFDGEVPIDAFISLFNQVVDDGDDGSGEDDNGDGEKNKGKYGQEDAEGNQGEH